MKRINGEDTSTISPTLGFNIKTMQFKRYVKNKRATPNERSAIWHKLGDRVQGVRSFRLNIWDVGGQKMLRTYWRNYYEQTDAMLWVVDSADAERMQVGQLPAVEGLLLRFLSILAWHD